MIAEVMNMKADKEKTGTYLMIALSAAGFFLCLIRPQETGKAAAEGIGRCLGVIIPSLYAVMVMSQLFIRSGAADRTAPFFSLAGRLFGMNGDEFAVFVFSSLAGYPVGAKMLCGRAEQGRINSERGSLLCGLCFGAGPSFIHGCIAAQLYGSPWTGRAVMLSCAAANIILGLVFSPLLRKGRTDSKYRSKADSSAEMFTECVSESGRSVLEICFAVVIFAVIAEMIRNCGAVQALCGILSDVSGRSEHCVSAILGAILDVTAVSELPSKDYSLLPVISALVSFGGVCVFFQLRTIIRGRFSMGRIVGLRIAAAFISYIACRIITPLLITGKVVEAASVSASVHKAQSPVPSVLLIIMTVILIARNERTVK